MAAIGIRVPDARFIRAVARQHRSALALTSANVSGGQSSVAVQEFRVSCGGSLVARAGGGVRMTGCGVMWGMSPCAAAA